MKKRSPATIYRAVRIIILKEMPFLYIPMENTAQIGILKRKRLQLSGEISWSVFVLFPLIILLICSSGNPLEYSSRSLFPSPAAEDSVSTVTISFIGDLMCHVPQINNAKQVDGTYDFNPSFKEITPFLSAADITMGNLECTFAGKGRPYGGYPAFNSPDEYLQAIKNAGVDFLCTSNNHSMDTGEEGLQRTLKKVREISFPPALSIRSATATPSACSISKA